MLTTTFTNLISENVFKHEEESTIPEMLYLGLSTTEPAEDGTNITEPSTEYGYSRVAISNTDDDFGEADADGIVSNTSPFYFAEATSAWEGIAYYVLFDSDTLDLEGDVDDTVLAYGAFSEPFDVPLKSILSIPVGKMQLKITSAD